MPRDGSSTRDRLLQAAGAAYLEHPVAAVSLREINVASGSRNTAAVHQHFGDRDGLDDALVARVLPALARAREVAASTAAPATDPDAPPDRVARLRTLVAAMVAPLATLLDQPLGPGALRLGAAALADPPARPPAWLDLLTGADDPVTRRLLDQIEALAELPSPVWALHRQRLLETPLTELARRARAESRPRAGARQPVVAALIDALAAAVVMPPSDALLRAAGLAAAPATLPAPEPEPEPRSDQAGLADRLREATQGIRERRDARRR